MKKVFCFVAIVMVVCLCAAPAFAEGYWNGGTTYNTYFAVIPYRMAVWQFDAGLYHGMSYSCVAPGQQYLRTSSAIDWNINGHDPAWMPVVVEMIGFDHDDGDAGTYQIAEFSHEQVYYAQPSNLYATTNKYSSVKHDGVLAKEFSVAFTATGFSLSLADYANLCSYAYMGLSAGVQADVNVYVEYWALDEGEWTLNDGGGSITINATSSGNYAYYPSGIFDTRLEYPNGLVPIESMILSVRLRGVGTGGYFSPGMLYGRGNTIGDAMDFVAEKEVVRVVEKLPDGLDLFGWLVDPIEAFLELEIVPNVTLGGIFGILLAVGLVLAVIAIFGGK